MDNNEIQKQFAVYNYDYSVIFKQGQDHQPWYELVDCQQSRNSTSFEKPRLNSVREKANDKVIVKLGNMSIMSLEYVWKWKKVVYS